MSHAEQDQSAATRMNEVGSENAHVAQRVGTWDVTETIWATPGAAPTSHTYVAERTMIGPFLQEVIRPAPGIGCAGSQVHLLLKLSLRQRLLEVCFAAYPQSGHAWVKLPTW